LPSDLAHRWRGLVATGAALLALAAGAAAAPASPATLLVVGDSLSAGYGIRVEEGWVALLAHRLETQAYGYHVVNASVSGETSLGALERLPHLLDHDRPAVVLIELGGNDGLRGLPTADLEAHLGRMVELSKAAGAAVVLVGVAMPANYGPEYTAKFAAVFPAVAARCHLPLVRSLIEPLGSDLANFQADGIHPNAAVQPRLLDHVWQTLAPVLKTHRPAGY
jgi:acyl-CoA thioesterase I